MWREITDEAKSGEDVLLWGPGLGHIVAQYDTECANSMAGQYPWATLDGPNYHKDAFTLWMPLPPLPA